MLVFTVISTLLILFLAMIVVGFVRFRKPESGWLLIMGFPGLAVSSYVGQMLIIYHLRELGRTGILSFNSQSTLYWMFASQCGIWVPLIILLALFITGWVGFSHKSSKWFLRIGGAGVLILWVVAFMAPTGPWPLFKTAEAEMKAGTYDIEIALDSYTSDHNGLYPEHIETLVDEGFLTAFPKNRFSYEQMKNVPYGSTDFEGNFTYFPVMVGEEIHGFYIIGYGYKTNYGMRLLNPDLDDHAIILMSSNTDDSSWPEGVPFPEIKDVIQSAVMTEF